MPDPRCRTARLLACIVIGATAAACGSTVAQAPLGSSTATTGGGLSAATASRDAAGGQIGTSADTAAVPPGQGGVRVSSGVAGASPEAQSTGAGSAPVGSAVGPGVTPTTIAIGLVDVTNTAATYSALGASNISTGDLRRQQIAMLNYINSHGGVAGRRLVPVWYELSSASNQTAEQQAQHSQAMCEAFSHDHKTFAVIWPADDTLASCLTARGVTMITSAINSVDSAFYARYPAVVNIANLNLDRMARAWVPQLVKAQYFTGWDTLTQQATTARPKLGIVVLDQPPYVAALRRTLLPTLARHGYRDSEIQLISANDAGNTTAAVSSAVLRFKAEGVDHVLFLESNGFLMFSFANAAHGQRYFPRYGVTSQNALGYFVSSGNVPAQTAVGAIGIGWIPTLDLPWGSREAVNEPRRRCDAIMAASSQTATNSNNELNLLKFCDSFFFLQTAARGLRTPTQANLLAAIDRMGESFASGYTISTFFSAGRHDGAASYRDMAYLPSCECFRYTSGPRDIG